MEQENIYEDEIDLKELLYVIFKKWRGLIVCALVFAVLAGGYKFISFSRSDAEADARETYEKTVEDYDRQKNDLETQISSDEMILEIIEEYISNVNTSRVSAEDLALISDNMLSVQNRIKSNTQALNDLLDQDEPELTVPSSGAVKYTVLGFVLGGFLGVFAVCVAYLMSDKVRGMKELQRRFKLKPLGTFDSKKRSSFPIDRLIDHMFGVKKSPEYEETCGVVAANVANYLDRDSRRVLVTGSASSDDIKKASEILIGQSSGDGFLNTQHKPDFVVGGPISDPHTIKSVSSCDEVILVERTGVTSMSDVEEELSLFKNLNKKVTGVILF